jgi:arylsulfatase A-like enzyme
MLRMSFSQAATSRPALLSCFVAVVAASAAWFVHDVVHAKADATQPATQPAHKSTQPTAGSLASPLNSDRSNLPVPDPSLIRSKEPHMLVISIDGLRPDCMLRADTPNLRALMARGAFTLYARTTDIAITTPSHISMLTGVTPERHGITFNGDPPDDAKILVPTIFDYAHDAGLSTGLASGKRKFTLFTWTKHVDWSALTADTYGPDGPVGAWAEQIIREHKPRFMFVHFPGADVAGHAIGWGTPEQIAAIGKIDKAVGGVVQAVQSAGLADDTYIIVTADHGGSARSHGHDDPRSRYIPWIFVGPGVRKNFDLTRLGRDYDIATYDTFATSCFILGLPVPGDSDGKPILPAFEDFDLLAAAAPTTKPTTRP